MRPWHGVVVYGPRPTYHRNYGPGPAQVRKRHLPKRSVDRDDTFALGGRLGSYWGGYEQAHGFADLGVGLTGRYRPDENVGLELAVQHYNQTWNDSTERATTTAQGSVMLFASPWSRVSPYLLGGFTWTGRQVQDTIFSGGEVTTVSTTQPLFGPHAGIGLEFALGQSVAFDIEARYAGYLNASSPGDLSLPGALTTTAGVVLHF